MDSKYEMTPITSEPAEIYGKVKREPEWAAKRLVHLEKVNADLQKRKVELEKAINQILLISEKSVLANPFSVGE